MLHARQFAQLILNRPDAAITADVRNFKSLVLHTTVPFFVTADYNTTDIPCPYAILPVSAGRPTRI
jgi:hypothetical protein